MAYGTSNTPNFNGDDIPDGAIPQIWAQRAKRFLEDSDWFKGLEGPSNSNVVVSKRDTTKTAGTKINFPLKAGVYGRAKLSDQDYQSANDFEAPQVGEGFSLQVDYVRKALQFNRRQDTITAMRFEIENGTAQNLGEWWGRWKRTTGFLHLITRSATSSRMLINGATTINDLRSDDTLSWNSIVDFKGLLQNMGGSPAMVGTSENGGDPQFRWIIGATHEALASLKKDSDYKDYVKQTAGSSMALRSPLFTGEYVDVDGNVIRPVQATDHHADGTIASTLAPRAILGEAVAADVAGTQQYLKGSTNANTLVDYFQDFPGFAFPLRVNGSVSGYNVSSDAISWTGSIPDTDGDGTGPYYALVYNPTTKKFGFIMYEVNSGYRIEIKQKFAFSGATSNGVTDLKTTVGNIVYGSLPANGWTTDKLIDAKTTAYPANSIVIPCNSYGVPYGYTLMLGKEALYRGYGEHEAKRDEDVFEGGFIRQVYFSSVFGQVLARDLKSRTPNVGVLCHTVLHPGIPFPTVT